MAKSLEFLVIQAKGNLGITESKLNMSSTIYLYMYYAGICFVYYYCDDFLKKFNMEVFPVTANLEFLTFSAFNLPSNFV